MNHGAMPANFNPDVLAAASRHDAEGLARRESGRTKLVLHGADFVERLARLGGQQLVEHPFHRLQGERARRQLQLAGRSDPFRLVGEAAGEPGGKGVPSRRRSR